MQGFREKGPCFFMQGLSFIIFNRILAAGLISGFAFGASMDK